MMMGCCCSTTSTLDCQDALARAAAVVRQLSCLHRRAAPVTHDELVQKGRLPRWS